MNVVGLDVETMGLDPEHKSLTTIGVYLPKNKSVITYFIEKPSEEREAIRWFGEKLKESAPCRLVTWRDFDVGFIQVRAAKYGLPNPFENISAYIDLHECAANRIQYDGGDIHLTDAADMFGLNTRKVPSENMPALYLRWLGGDSSCRRKIEGHCKQDVEMMMGVYKKLGCERFQKGKEHIAAILENENLFKPFRLSAKKFASKQLLMK